MFEKIFKPIEDAGISAGFVLIILAIVGYSLLPSQATFVGLDALIKYAPLWLSIVFFFIFKQIWMDYVQIRRLIQTEYVLLEIKLPEEITQSPLAMETALSSFFYTGEPAQAYEKYIEGRLRAQFSLEIASFEGSLHFFIRTRAKERNIIEAQLYSQYPTIEIHEVPDYMPNLPYDPKTTDLFGVYQVLQKADPYPIKTYVEFGLDKETKEEFKIDPMASILEFFGSFGEGEYGLFQVIIRSHQSEKRAPGAWFKKEDWKEEAKREVEKIVAEVRGTGDTPFMTRPFTEEEQDVMKALDRNTAKKPFDTGIRMIYMAEKDKFRSDRRGGLPTIMRTFESHTLNGFKPKFPTMFTYPWQDPFGYRVKAKKRELYEGYRWRSYLAPPYKHPHFVLSAEELATIFHFPGRVVQTPTIGRITSRKEEAPPNIPR